VVAASRLSSPAISLVFSTRVERASGAADSVAEMRALRMVRLEGNFDADPVGVINMAATTNNMKTKAPGRREMSNWLNRVLLSFRGVGRAGRENRRTTAVVQIFEMVVTGVDLSGIPFAGLQ